MQRFSKASVVVITAFVTTLVVNIISADISSAGGAQGSLARSQSSAFKRQASMETAMQQGIKGVSEKIKQTAAITSRMQQSMNSVSTPKNKRATESQAPKKLADNNQGTTSAQPSLPTTSSFSQVSTYWKSNSGKKVANASEKMKVYSEPDRKGRVLTSISTDQNFTVEQGDWVRVKTPEGVTGWAMVKDVEQNINNAWNEEYQVVINGQSSNYSVTKISAAERIKRQEAMRTKQMERMKRLSRLWEEDFFAFNDAGDDVNEVKDLKNQVLALSEKIKTLEGSGKKKST